MTATQKTDGNPGDQLKSEFRNLLGAFGERAITSVRDRVGETAGRLTEYAVNGGGPGLMAAASGVKDLAEGKSPARALLGAGLTGTKEQVKKLFGRGGGKGGDGKGGSGTKIKLINIVESTDVGVPVRVAYNQWTQFRDFPSFMKKVESAEQESEEKLHWRAQIFWSHRNWESTIIKQVPDETIVWRSKGAKGYVDGAVTFHDLAPRMTRILLVLEYHPKGFFEQTGNLWRAQGRRARLELKHFRRQVMTQVILNPDDVEGWRGVIEDGKVVKDHETSLAEEQGEDGREAGDEYPEEYADQYPDDEYAEDQYPDDGATEGAAEDEYPGESGGQYGEDEEFEPATAEYEPMDDEMDRGETAGGEQRYRSASDQAVPGNSEDGQDAEVAGRPARPASRHRRVSASERRG